MCAADLNDEKCLAATLDAVEADIPQTITNANACTNGKISSISFRRYSRAVMAVACTSIGTRKLNGDGVLRRAQRKQLAALLHVLRLVAAGGDVKNPFARNA